MVKYSLFILALVSCALGADLVPRREPESDDDHGGNGGAYDDDSGHHGGDDGSATSSPTTSSPTGNSTAGSSASLTGATQCTNLMCISAVVNGSTVTYTMIQNSNTAVGWMGMGFGTQMANTPMVIMWPNSDGNITLSQRQATGHVEPSVVANPPRLASSLASASSVTSGSTKLAFTIPAISGTTQQPVIYAFGTQAPSSSAANAKLLQHADQGVLTLDLSQPIGANTPGTTQPGLNSGSGSIPLRPYQRYIIAHAIFCVLGFLLFLPAGALLARYFRTFSPTWFKGHWIFQFAIAGPTILIGFSLGVKSVAEAGAVHLDDKHKKLGVAIFVLYLVQLGVGAFIHWVKDKNRTKRPPQNYFHAVFGLLIIALAMYQVHLGYDVEWPSTTARGDVPSGVNIIFYIWIVLLPVLYAAGLAFLPKQLRQEKQVRVVRLDDHEDTNQYNLGHVSQVYRD